MIEHDLRLGHPGEAVTLNVVVDVEEPEADVVEQHLLAEPTDSAEDAYSGPLPLDADPADTLEQRQVVALDEDDYR